MTGLRVLIADDHPVFRGGLRALLATDPDLEVVAEAADGAEAIALTAREQPDVVLMDLHMPDRDGVDATREILQADPHVIEFFATGQTRPAVAFPQLTDRERDVLDLLAQGLTNSRIAGRLSISEKTVRNHVSNIFAKLAVADRAQAVVRAREGGLGTPPAYEGP
jgi:DNA-binding NarL/FixJ family response regulator